MKLSDAIFTGLLIFLILTLTSVLFLSIVGVGVLSIIAIAIAYGAGTAAVVCFVGGMISVTLLSAIISTLFPTSKPPTPPEAVIV